MLEKFMVELLLRQIRTGWYYLTPEIKCEEAPAETRLQGL